MPIAINEDEEMAAHWKTQIELCDKETRRFHRRGKIISEKYRDDRGSASDGDRPDTGNKRTLNLFWSNVQTMKPAIYAKCPVPICERRFLDKDTTGRVASTILERALRYEVQMSGFDNAVRRARNDYLLPGRGTVWIRYNPKFGDPISPKQVSNDEITFGDQQDDEPQDEARVQEEEAQERVVEAESLSVDYLHWQDYYTFPPKARTEDEIEGKGRRLFMSRQDLTDMFGKEGKKVPLDHVPHDDENGRSQTKGDNLGDQATVYEIWWKPERRVYFVAKQYDKCLIPEGQEASGQGVDDPLHLEGFFPCPPPLQATMTNDTLIPVPDYAEAQDQYSQIDDLTKRIDVLTNACKVRGVYDASAQGVKRVFEEGQEPDLIPVDSWAMFAEKGGLKGAIEWMPLEDIAKTLQILIEVRKEIMNDLDRVTGINDINRGTSDARETLGGVRIKQNSTSGRLQERQDEMARFCRDIISIMGEIVSELYSEETLIQVSGALFDEGLDPPALPPPMMGHNGGPPMGPPPMNGQQPPPPSMAMPPEDPMMKQQRKLQMILEAIGLLRNDKLRGFRIDIETDSTIQGDAEQEKQHRIEFVEGVTKFIETAAQVTMGVPEFAPLAAKMLQFAVRGFRVGRDLESAIEEFADKAETDAKAKALQPPPPNPEMIKAQSEQAKAQASIEQVKIQGQYDNQQLQMETQMKQMDIAMKKMEIQIEQMRVQAEMAKTHMEMTRDNQEHQLRGAEAIRDFHLGNAEHSRKMDLMHATHDAKLKQLKEPKQ